MKVEPGELLLPHAGASIDSAVPQRRAAIYGLLGGLTAWLAGWYWTTATSIEWMWSKNETYTHGYLIAPISLYLIWRRRATLARVPLRPAWVPLVALGVLGMAWLAADVAQVLVVKQYCLILMLICSTWVVLGTAFVQAVAFPLAFLLFAVPFGEFLIPPLISFTADFTVGALRLTGLPVFREGTHFTLPSGSWSVAEACSGLRYLVASITLGCLYAYLTYRRTLYRVVFVLLSIGVPILANGLRAYMIVMLGHLSGMRIAVGVDHLIYGWFFFGLVMLLLFWAGSFWREDELEAAPAGSFGQPKGSGTDAPASRTVGAALAAAVVAAAWPAYAARLEVPRGAPRVPTVEVAGWRVLSEPLSTWTPHYPGARARFDRTYRRGEAQAALFIGYYRNQGDESKLVSSINGVVVSARPAWIEIAGGSQWIGAGELAWTAREAQLRGPEKRLLVWHWYWVGGTHTTNPVQAKLLQARNRLLGRGDDGAVVMLSTAVPENLDAARAMLARFAADALPAIDASLDHAQEK